MQAGALAVARVAVPPDEDPLGPSAFRPGGRGGRVRPQHRPALSVMEIFRRPLPLPDPPCLPPPFPLPSRRPSSCRPLPTMADKASITAAHAYRNPLVPVPFPPMELFERGTVIDLVS